MSREMIMKIIRCFVVALCFICLLSIMGVKEREAQQFGMMLGIIAIFGFLLRNIWLTLFLGWTVFLYSFFKFQLGNIYLSNIFYGCILYYISRLAFEKKHIDFFINALLWLTFINTFYMAIQISGYDFYYEFLVGGGKRIHNTTPVGFMSNTGYLGCLVALAMPFLATRGSKWAIAGSLGLFVPLYLSDSTLCILAATIGLLFVIFYTMPKKLWALILMVLIIGGLFYAAKIDSQSWFRFTHWRKVLHYGTAHPITGWGLDSYRNITEQKNFIFAHIESYWDNPHNIIVSLFFEFGVVGVFLFFGYLRHLVMKFNRSIKDRNTLALAGFALVFVLLSLGHFPLFLARCAVFIIPAFALFEVQTSA